ncbi:MAG: efflux RND transporter periplasmic adaptor subunit, partial [Planctomycetota bacterium]
GESHGKWLRTLRARRDARKKKATWANFLFIRVSVFDPDRLLDFLYGYARLVMNPVTMWMSLLFVAVSWIAGLSQLQNIGNLAFPVLGWQNLLLLSATFLVVKVIHEFGHGLAAKHHGLEVHDMGILFMVFMPMFYVDVSDAWMVPRRRDRLWINAGGVCIEFLFASVAVWVWLGTDPGVVNQIAFNTMLAASVTTLLFNINPLMKYDGYYFLMDWMQIPNLRAKAGQFTGHLAKKYILGIKDQKPPREAASHPIFMPLYAISAGVYRWFVVLGIIAMVWHVLDPYGLEVIGSILGSVALVTMVGLPLFKMLKFIWVQQAKTWRRMAATVAGAGALGLLAWGILSIEMEHAIEQPIVVLAEHRTTLYVPADGRIERVLVEPGQVVEAGQPLLVLRNDGLQSSLDMFRVEREQTLLRRDMALQEGRQEIVSALASTLRYIDESIQNTEQKIKRLTVRAQFDGRLLASERLHASIGKPMRQGDLLGVFIGQGQPHFEMVLPQADASLIREGLSARARLWSDPSVTYEGVVMRVGSQFIDFLPHESLAGMYQGEVDSMPKDEYKSEPSTPSVVATIHFDTAGITPRDGMTGRGKIILGRSSLGQQQWRLIQKAVSLDWWL